MQQALGIDAQTQHSDRCICELAHTVRLLTRGMADGRKVRRSIQSFPNAGAREAPARPKTTLFGPRTAQGVLKEENNGQFRSHPRGSRFIEVSREHLAGGSVLAAQRYEVLVDMSALRGKAKTLCWIRELSLVTPKRTSNSHLAA